MLYTYKGKVYVRPFMNKIVEVKIEKNEDGTYDVKATKNEIYDENITNKLTSISLEEAYKFLRKNRE